MTFQIAEGVHWWAIRTRSNFERKVEQQLTSRDVEAFLPTYQRPSNRKDRRVWVTAPLFSGYLFVHADLSEMASRVEVLRTRGLVNIVGGPLGPVPIPAFEIENVRLLCDSDKMVAPWERVHEGSVVRVISGGLAGVVGIVVEIKGKTKRLICNVDLLNRAVSAELGAEDIELLDERDYAQVRRKLLRGQR